MNPGISHPYFRVALLPILSRMTAMPLGRTAKVSAARRAPYSIELPERYFAVYCPRLTRLNIFLWFSKARLTIVRKLLLLVLCPAFFAA